MDADGECFRVGTMLATPSGSVKVEDLTVGASLVSYTHPTMLDESEENWRDWSSTEGTFNFGTSNVVATRRFTANGSVDINGIVTTKHHIHMIYDGEAYGWKHAIDVLHTDKLVSNGGELVDILNITISDEPTEFVAVNVETVDTLVIKNGDTMILGHNASA